MAKHQTEKLPRREKVCNGGIFRNGFVAFGIAISLFPYATDAFSFQGLINQNYKNALPRAHLRWSVLYSTKDNASLNATSIPYFVNPRDTPIEPTVSISMSTIETPRDIQANNGENVKDSMFPGILKLASMHCASQALSTAVRMKIPDFLGEKTMSVEELARLIENANPSNKGLDKEERLPCHRDALLRILRLLVTIDVVREELAEEGQGFQISPSMSMGSSFRFSLTPLGLNLRTSPTNEVSMSSSILHWMEEPLWNSWLEVPDYIREGGFEDKEDTLLPFERANGAVSSDDYYNQDDHPESLKHANDFVRLIHEHELKAVVEGFDWSHYKNQRLVDVAGNNGKLAEAIAESEPSLDCTCLDLPSVIGSILPEQQPKNVKLVSGNVLSPDTIPDCEVILLKHFCDRCMWFDDQTVEILRSCKTALQRSGQINPRTDELQPRRKLVIADAVLPDCGNINEQNELSLYMDTMYMLVGRERQRTRSEWKALGEAAGLRLSGIIETGVPSCSLIVLEPKDDLSSAFQ